MLIKRQKKLTKDCISCQKKKHLGDAGVCLKQFWPQVLILRILSKANVNQISKKTWCHQASLTIYKHVLIIITQNESCIYLSMESNTQSGNKWNFKENIHSKSVPSPENGRGNCNFFSLIEELGNSWQSQLHGQLADLAYTAEGMGRFELSLLQHLQSPQLKYTRCRLVVNCL